MITSIESIEAELKPEMCKARKAIINGRKPFISLTSDELNWISLSGKLKGGLENPTYEGVPLKVSN